MLNLVSLSYAPMHPVQLSLDLIDLDEALNTAEIALRAGVDWLEVGTPLIIAEGMRACSRIAVALSRQLPIVADLKIMDGGGLEAELAIKPAHHGRRNGTGSRRNDRARRQGRPRFRRQSHGRQHGHAGSRRRAHAGLSRSWLRLHRASHRLRYANAAPAARAGAPRRRSIVCAKWSSAVAIPVQAVGGLTLEQATETPAYGAPLVVIGAPLAIDAHAFRTAEGDLEGTLRMICEKVHAFGDVAVKRGHRAMNGNAGARQLRPRAFIGRAARCTCPRNRAQGCVAAVGAVSVCGSDLHQWRGSHSWPVNYPCILGHEFGAP